MDQSFPLFLSITLGESPLPTKSTPWRISVSLKHLMPSCLLHRGTESCAKSVREAEKGQFAFLFSRWAPPSHNFHPLIHPPLCSLHSPALFGAKTSRKHFLSSSAMMLGAHALRSKQKESERKDRDRRDRAKELQKAAKCFGEAAQSVFTERRPSSSRPVGSRAHSIYDFGALSARTSGEHHSNKNAKLRARFSLNVGNLSAREQPKKKRNSSGSFQSLLLTTPRSMSGPAASSEQLSASTGRARAGSTSAKSTVSTSSALSSAGTRLLKWLGLWSGGHDNGRRVASGRQQKKCKRRLSAL